MSIPNAPLNAPMPNVVTQNAPPLRLDERQRALLMEMGVRVFSPLPDAVVAAKPPQNAPKMIAAQAAKSTASAVFAQKNELKAAALPLTAPGAAVALAPALAAVGTASWQLAAPHRLFADRPPGDGGARWLVLAQTPESALQTAHFDPLGGDAGTLLGNMLRAARLAEPGRVLLVPLAQLGGDGPAPACSVSDSALAAALAALVQSYQPHLLLIMGRLAAQVLLRSSEPLGKLRGQVHRLHGVRTVVTYDAPPLLRTPLDKAKAWDDLCLAMVQANDAARP